MKVIITKKFRYFLITVKTTLRKLEPWIKCPHIFLLTIKIASYRHKSKISILTKKHENK